MLILVLFENGYFWRYAYDKLVFLNSNTKISPFHCIRFFLRFRKCITFSINISRWYPNPSNMTQPVHIVRNMIFRNYYSEYFLTLPIITLQGCIKEMNKLGMMIDIQYLSTPVQQQILNISKAPVMISHTASNSLNDYIQNVDNTTLSLLVRKKLV